MQNNTIRSVLIGLLVLAGIYLIADHGQHLVPYLPFVFLSGCLVMHLFMHGGHGHGNHNDQNQHDHDQPKS